MSDTEFINLKNDEENYNQNGESKEEVKGETNGNDEEENEVQSSLLPQIGSKFIRAGNAGAGMESMTAGIKHIGTVTPIDDSLDKISEKFEEDGTGAGIESHNALQEKQNLFKSV